MRFCALCVGVLYYVDEIIDGIPFFIIIKKCFSPLQLLVLVFFLQVENFEVI